MLKGKTSIENTTVGANLAESNTVGRDLIQGDQTLNYNIIVQYQDSTLSPEVIKQKEQRYLKRMVEECGNLQWLSLMRKESSSSGQSLKLGAVYTPLLTESFIRDEDKQAFDELSDVVSGSSELVQRGANMAQERRSAVDMLNQEQRLVLTGNPGSGKSAFVDYLVLCLSGEHLKLDDVNINTLTDPLPDRNGKPITKEVEENGEKVEREVRQHWTQKALLPIRIILRDFAASDCFPSAFKDGDASHLIQFLHTELTNKSLDDCIEVLEARIKAGDVLFLLDGLDEVPKAGEKRQRLLACIQGLVKSYADCRFLVTCRPYAYQDSDWNLSGFKAVTLSPFNNGQIIYFIQRWYASTAEYQKNAEQRAEKLQNAILHRSALHDLGKRPLLLSLIAYLHANRHELPDRRADLYEKLLGLLIDEWEKARFKTEDCDRAKQLEQYSLAEFLEVGQDTIRLVLERLAFKAHALQDKQASGTADIAATDLTTALYYCKDEEFRPNIDKLNEYLRDRVGILYHRGGTNEANAVYTFPHRSFQEYLTAAYFRREEDTLFDFLEEQNLYDDCDTWQALAAELVRNDPDRWREVVALAGGIKATTEPRPVWELVKELYVDDAETLTRQDAWGLRLASEIMAESLLLDNLNRGNKRAFETIQQALPKALDTDQLPAKERAAIGRYLAHIGDPRPEVNTIDAMPFCYVPAGKFWMGKGEWDKEEDAFRPETPNGEYDLNYPYWIAQHPVTTAQFKQFVEATGYDNLHENTLQGVSNAPAAYISQLDASAFCQWLTEYWQQKGALGKEWRVTLPNEPEWEKAARGGLEVPQEPFIKAIGYVDDPKPSMISNSLSQRRYPFGNELDDEQINYSMNIGYTTTLGLYPKGASPYGCYDMAGNIWEWTRSILKDYPYPKVGTTEWHEREVASKQNLEQSTEPSACVLGGGSFYDYGRDVRCSVYDDFMPDSRNHYSGFRVVLSPSFSER